jgi:hypothetical protein
MREVAGPFPAHLSLETSRSTLSVGPVIRPSPASHATPFPQSLPAESESIHSRTLGLWRMAQLVPGGSFWFGFDVSVAAIRSSPNTSLRGGRSPGSWVTRSYAARTAAPPAQQVFGRGRWGVDGETCNHLDPRHRTEHHGRIDMRALRPPARTRSRRTSPRSARRTHRRHRLTAALPRSIVEDLATNAMALGDGVRRAK